MDLSRRRSTALGPTPVSSPGMAHPSRRRSTVLGPTRESGPVPVRRSRPTVRGPIRGSGVAGTTRSLYPMWIHWRTPAFSRALAFGIRRRPTVLGLELPVVEPLAMSRRSGTSGPIHARVPRRTPVPALLVRVRAHRIRVPGRQIRSRRRGRPAPPRPVRCRMLRSRPGRCPTGRCRAAHCRAARCQAARCSTGRLPGCRHSRVLRPGTTRLGTTKRRIRRTSPRIGAICRCRCRRAIRSGGAMRLPLRVRGSGTVVRLRPRGRISKRPIRGSA